MRLLKLTDDDDDAADDDDELELSPARDIDARGMAVAAVPLLLVALLGFALKLGNVRTLLIAAARCVTQLLLLGLLLYPVLRHDRPHVVLPYVAAMALLATREAAVKPKHSYRGMWLHMLTAICVSTTAAVAALSFGVLRPHPWHSAQVVIPTAGMLLGSCVNALSLGVDRFLVSLRGDAGRGSPRVQALLACGATRWEAALPSVRQAVETGLTPNLNQMAVMGLVSIPGMFTGQILGGTPPMVAAKYQIVIMFFVCSNSTVILFLVVLQAVFGRLFDPRRQFFRADLVRQRRDNSKPKDVVLALVSSLGSGLNYLLRKFAVSNDDDDACNGRNDPKNTSTKKNDAQEERDFFNNDNNHPAPPGSSSTTTKCTFQRVVAAQNSAGETTPKSSDLLLLKLTGGKISYNGRPLLSNLELELGAGEIIVLQGRSGCGKSTFLRALALLESPEEGQLSFRGSTELAATKWRSEIIYVHQSGGQGLQGTPRELLRQLSSLHSQSNRKMEAVDVEKRLYSNLAALDLAEEGESNMIDRPWDLMSGGEAQRVYLCVLLALHPSVLLLDEPTTACDEQATRKVENLVVRSGIATVWVSHDPCQMERFQQLAQTSVLRFRESLSP